MERDAGTVSAFCVAPLPSTRVGVGPSVAFQEYLAVPSAYDGGRANEPSPR